MIASPTPSSPRAALWPTVLLLGISAAAVNFATGRTDGLYTAGALLWLNVAVAAALATIFIGTPRLSRVLLLIAVLASGGLAIWSRLAFEIVQAATRQQISEPEHAAELTTKASLWIAKGYFRLDLAVAAFAMALVFGAGILRGCVGRKVAIGAIGTLVAASFVVLFIGPPGTVWNAHYDVKGGFDVAPLSQPGGLVRASRPPEAQYTDDPVAAARKQPEQAAAAKLATVWQVGLLAVGLCAAAATVRWRWIGHASLAALIVSHLSLGAWVIRHTPGPHIDVWHFQQESCKALLDGKNPYAIDMPNMYGQDSFVYGRELQHEDRVLFGYPYPPLSLYMALPGYRLGGDVRYSQLAALAIAAALIALARPGILATLAAMLLLFSSRVFMVVEMAWTEPFVIVLLAAVVFCACRFPRTVPYVLGLFLASKQYLIFAVPLAVLLLARPFSWKAYTAMLCKAAAVALAVSLPLILYSPAKQFAPGKPQHEYQQSAMSAFQHSAITLQLKQPLRRDALSYLAWYYWHFDQDMSPDARERSINHRFGWCCFAAAALAIAASLWRFPRNGPGFAAGVALTYLLFLSTSKQAFCNYYFFVLAALCIAIAATRTNEAALQIEACEQQA
ncbi:MAG: hypothetical protein ABSH20_10620 [Tepidisphaeraceae bacterium]|jgi:hypothetical protein